MFLTPGSFHSFPTPARPLGASQPLTCWQGARASGKARSMLSDSCSGAAPLRFYRAHRSRGSLLKRGSDAQVWAGASESAVLAGSRVTLQLQEPGKAAGSPATPVISRGFRVAHLTSWANQHLPLPDTPHSGVQHLPGSCSENSPAAPSGTGLPAGDAHHPRTRPG